jgi:signal transduction histidine kinase
VLRHNRGDRIEGKHEGTRAATGGFAHDFRNILAIIESGLRLAEKSAEAPEQVRACIEGAKEGVDRGLQLISQLLTFAKQQEFDLRAADANEVLRNFELLLKYGAGPAIRLIFELAPDIPALAFFQEAAATLERIAAKQQVPNC